MTDQKRKTGNSEEPATEPATGICKECQEPIPEPTFIEVAGKKIYKRWCDPCIEVLAEASISRANRIRRATIAKARQERFEALCDPIYRESDPAKAPMGREKFIAVINHDFTAGGSVILTGATGSGKTRAAFGLLKRECLLGRRCRVATASGFRTGLTASRREGKDLYLSNLIHCDVLLLDDLGQIAGTPAATEALHELIERRTAKRKDTIITTQDTAKMLASRFASIEAGEAICRRIADYFTKYSA